MAEVLMMTTVVVVVIAVAIYASKQAAKRREELAAFAFSIGLTFHAARQRDFRKLHRHSVFSRGSARAAYNTMEGRLEIAGFSHAAILGEYKYTISTGKSSHTYRFSFILLRPSWIRLPDLEIRKEHIGDKLSAAFGFDDIDFESEEFSRKFMVKSADKRFAYAVCHPRMMEFLLAKPDLAVEICDGECLLMESVRVWSPTEYRSNLAWARSFFELWPGHLTRSLSGKMEGR